VGDTRSGNSRQGIPSAFNQAFACPLPRPYVVSLQVRADACGREEAVFFYLKQKDSPQRIPRLKVNGFFKYLATSSRLLCEGLFLSFQSPINVL
jgi:hypothetical protein